MQHCVVSCLAQFAFLLRFAIDSRVPTTAVSTEKFLGDELPPVGDGHLAKP